MKQDAPIHQFAGFLMNLKKKEEVIDFLEGILTPQEKEQLPQRLEIVRQLKRGIPQREIANDLKVGIATVTRGARELKKNRFYYV